MGVVNLVEQEELVLEVYSDVEVVKIRGDVDQQLVILEITICDIMSTAQGRRVNKTTKRGQRKYRKLALGRLNAC